MRYKLTAANLNDPITKYVHADISTLQENATVGETMSWLRNQQLSEELVYFYVLNDANQLVGVVPVRRLLMAPLTEKISSLMLRDVVAVPIRGTVLLACELFLFYRYLALPVINEKREFLGIVDISLFTDEISALAEQRQVENAFQLIGVHLSLGRGTPWASFKDRFPWLLVNIGGGLLCALVISRFEPLIEMILLLTLFIPVVLALAESVSMQSMTLTVQALPDDPRQTEFLLATALRREMVVAMLIGAASGIIVGAIGYLWQRNVIVALVIGGAIFLSMITACLLGVAIPSVVRRFKMNPQVAAGPIVLATADIVALLFYFNLSGWLLEHI